MRGMHKGRAGKLTAGTLTEGKLTTETYTKGNLYKELTKKA